MCVIVHHGEARERAFWMVQWRRKSAMVRVTVLYPNESAKRFDHDYYARKHMPQPLSRRRSLVETYFIGYSRYLWVIEKMLQRMYVGDPPGVPNSRCPGRPK